MQKSITIFSQILLLFLFLNLGLSTSIFAQNKAYSDSSSSDSARKSRFQPSIRAGVGMLSYIGHEQSNSGRIQSPSIGRIAYDAGISQKISPVTEISLNLLYGTIAETEQISTNYWNFTSTVEGGGINLLFKLLPKQSLTPYILTGIESYRFLSNIDIYDQYGTEYYTWSDGTIRSVPQNATNSSSAKILTLGDNSTTNLLNNSGSYSLQTYSIPVGIGFMFHIQNRADFMVGSTLHYTFSNHIDGLNPQTQGPKSNDMLIYTYATLRFTLNSGPHKKPLTAAEIAFNKSLLADNVQPDVAPTVDTSSAAIQLQYEKYMDSTGKFAEHHVDNFQWKDPNKVSATPAKSTEAIKNTAATTPKVNTQTKVIATPAVIAAPAITPKAPVTTTNNTSGSKPGLIFKIQLGAFKYSPDQDFLNMFKKIKNGSVVKDASGLSHYMAGTYTDLKDATAAEEQAKAVGGKNATILPYYNGTYIKMPEALDLLKK